MDMNLKSAMLASRVAIPEMSKTGGGSIINISSCDAIASADHYGAPYSVSKGALHMLTRGTAAWLGVKESVPIVSLQGTFITHTRTIIFKNIVKDGKRLFLLA